MTEGPIKALLERLSAAGDPLAKELLNEGLHCAPTAPRLWSFAEVMDRLLQVLDRVPTGSFPQLPHTFLQLMMVVPSSQLHSLAPETARRSIGMLCRWLQQEPMDNHLTLEDRDRLLEALKRCLQEKVPLIHPSELAQVLDTCTYLISTCHERRRSLVPHAPGQGSSHTVTSDGGQADDRHGKHSCQPVIDLLTWLVAKAGSSMTQDQHSAALGSLVSYLRSRAPLLSPFSDPKYIRHHLEVLTTLTSTLMGSKGSWTGLAGALLEALRQYMDFGIRDGREPVAHGHEAVSQAVVLGGSAPASPKYVPPHLRNSPRSSNPAPASSSSPKAPRRWGSGPLRRDSWSDSDLSDSDSTSTSAAHHPTEQSRTARVRAAMLLCMQTMIKGAPRALQPLWSQLLPLAAPQKGKVMAPSLLSMMVMDPAPRVRSLSCSTLSTLMEGSTAKGYLSVAEVTSAPILHRGFTTLSTTLGLLVLACYDSLLMVVKEEEDMAVTCQALRALCTLLRATPHSRFPPELLPRVLQGVTEHWKKLTGSPSVQAQGHDGNLSATLACLAECLATKAPHQGVEQWLRVTPGCPGRQPIYCEHGQGSGPSRAPVPMSSWHLVYELFAAARHPQAVVRIEGLAALAGLTHHYPFVMDQPWSMVRDTIRANVDLSQRLGSTQMVPCCAVGEEDSEVSGSTSAEFKAAQHAMKLTGEYLLMCKAGPALPMEPKAEGVDDEMVGSWEEAAPLLLSVTRHHPSYMVRHAALGALLGLDDGTFVGLKGDLQGGILATTLTIIAVDKAASVRAAGCNLAAVLCHFGSLWDQMLRDGGECAGEGLRASQEAHCGPQHQCPRLQDGHPGPGASPGPWLLQLSQVLLDAAKDDKVKVRMAALLAVGSLCDAVEALVKGHVGERGLQAIEGAPLASLMSEQDPRKQGIRAGQSETDGMLFGQTEVSSTTASRNREMRRHCPLSSDQEPLLCLLLGNALAAAIRGTQDGDRVKPLGLRALGVLLGLDLMGTFGVNGQLTLGTDPNASSPLLGLLQQSLELIVSNLSCGVPKTEWNACFAMAQLYRNEQLCGHPLVTCRLSELQFCLLIQLEETDNMKVRSHAAIAAGFLPVRQASPEVMLQSILVLSRILQAGQSLNSGRWRVPEYHRKCLKIETMTGLGRGARHPAGCLHGVALGCRQECDVLQCSPDQQGCTPSDSGTPAGWGPTYDHLAASRNTTAGNTSSGAVALGDQPGLGLDQQSRPLVLQTTAQPSLGPPAPQEVPADSPSTLPGASLVVPVDHQHPGSGDALPQRFPAMDIHRAQMQPSLPGGKAILESSLWKLLSSCSQEHAAAVEDSWWVEALPLVTGYLADSVDMELWERGDPDGGPPWHETLCPHTGAHVPVMPDCSDVGRPEGPPCHYPHHHGKGPMSPGTSHLDVSVDVDELCEKLRELSSEYSGNGGSWQALEMGSVGDKTSVGVPQGAVTCGDSGPCHGSGLVAGLRGWQRLLEGRWKHERGLSGLLEDPFYDSLRLTEHLTNMMCHTA